MNDLNMIHIPESWGVKRTAPTPMEHRDRIYSLGKTYDEVFDWTTLFADAIDIGEGRVLLIGPPLYDLKDKLKFTDGKKELTHSFYDQMKCQLTLVETTSDVIYLDHPSETVEIKVSKPSTRFNGLKCASTTQRNESIIWIKDWVAYHHLEHGVEGFIIYDNNSDDYTPQQLQDELDSLPYDIEVEVVNWQMPFGPRTVLWDADYMQETHFEHLKYKYGWCCKCILNHDVDEMFMLNGMTLDDILGTMDQRGMGGLVYWNRNMEPYNTRLEVSAHTLEPDERRFFDYTRFSDENNTNPESNGLTSKRATKWIVIPSRMMEVQWNVHNFIGSGPIGAAPDGGNIYYAHHYSLLSKWKAHHPTEYIRTRNHQLIDLDETRIDTVAERVYPKYVKLLEY